MTTRTTTPPRKVTPAAAAAAAATGAAVLEPPPPAATAPTPPKVRLVRKVRATQVGYYNHVRRREGDVFVIEHDHEFSSRWMEPVDPSTREKVTSAPEALKRHHDELLSERFVPKGTPMVDDDSATGDLNPLLAK